jgi:hypothetical protein
VLEDNDVNCLLAHILSQLFRSYHTFAQLDAQIARFVPYNADIQSPLDLLITWFTADDGIPIQVYFS